VIAFPTDTVYGIGASVTDKKAVTRLFKIKKRLSNKPIPLLISSKSMLKKVALRIPATARKITDKYWPGAVTIIVPKRRSIPDYITKGSPNVAVRMPKNRIALSIIKACGGMLAVTSANISGEKAAVTAKELKGLKGIDLIIDGGKTRIGKASTVIDLSGNEPVILRKGPGFRI